MTSEVMASVERVNKILLAPRIQITEVDHPEQIA